MKEIVQFFSENSFSKIFVLVDENTFLHCYPIVKELLPIHSLIKIKSGETNKTLQTCEMIWKKLTDENADRYSLLVNIGGGVIGDMGGFAAGCYKRGIKFINIPTTLLAMVDASVGAKTGVDYLNFKNQIGLFKEPQQVFIYTDFLKTLSKDELLNGLAEVIKHYLIADANAFFELRTLIESALREEFDLSQMNWDELVQRNIAIKKRFVDDDKFEQGKRKALNFGHTIGHAMETYYLNEGKLISHGVAVAIGILCESGIAMRENLLSTDELRAVITTITSLYEKHLPGFPKKHIPKILNLIKQDKKNSAGENQFSLIGGIGNFIINRTVKEDNIIQSLEYYSELT